MLDTNKLIEYYKMKNEYEKYKIEKEIELKRKDDLKKLYFNHIDNTVKLDVIYNVLFPSRRNFC